MERLILRDPKRMYSSAVSNYLKFRVEGMDIENTIQDSYYGDKVEEYLITEEFRNPNLTQQSKLIEKEIKQYQRNPRVGAEALRVASYQCEVDLNHRSFISRRTKKNYVEAHHFIPIAYQGLFERGIDRVENIISLCPTCHRCIHYGENSDRIKMIHKLYQEAQSQLEKSSIEIREKELLELYQIY